MTPWSEADADATPRFTPYYDDCWRVADAQDVDALSDPFDCLADAQAECEYAAARGRL